MLLSAIPFNEMSSAMNQLTFDEDLTIREVLDDIIGMVDRREKLIESAAERAEDSKDDRMAQNVVQLQRLMSDFVALFDPIFVKVRAYSESLKQTISESEAFVKSLVGIIDAGKTIDGSSATVQELEKDADEAEENLRESKEILSRIENLFKRTKRYSEAGPRPEDGEAEINESRSRGTSHRTDRGSRSHIIAGGPRLSLDEPSKRHD